MGWLELPKHVMTAQIARALFQPGLEVGEPLEHVCWGGELPTLDGMKHGLGRLTKSAVEDAKQLRPEQALGAVVVVGGLLGFVAGLSAIGVQDAEDLLTVGGTRAPPNIGRLGILLGATPARVVLLDVHRCLVDAAPGKRGARTLVRVHSAFWWNRPIASSVPARMSEERVLWRRAVALRFRDDGVERRLSFPAQPGLPTNLEDARAIAKTCFGVRAQ